MYTRGVAEVSWCLRTKYSSGSALGTAAEMTGTMQDALLHQPGTSRKHKDGHTFSLGTPVFSSLLSTSSTSRMESWPTGTSLMCGTAASI
jgi:hypothetical protein